MMNVFELEFCRQHRVTPERWQEVVKSARDDPMLDQFVRAYVGGHSAVSLTDGLCLLVVLQSAQMQLLTEAVLDKRQREPLKILLTAEQLQGLVKGPKP